MHLAQQLELLALVEGSGIGATDILKDVIISFDLRGVRLLWKVESQSQIMQIPG